ncbi:MAG: glucose 1-dehydrogenase [Acidimicrobiales bacterium]|nr:glucose 1-dehydrogenase [Acidimicrobiia bacterium]NNC81796.1 glucose 1-dehydrogenase [Acidimicrobiales bacterium]RZV42569.1 MAG: glucose 1-dehydrogenase [Acidimicrobiales bacterium]
MEDLFGLAGKTAVVTGGSRGIGEMIAEGLVDVGAKVIITARKADALEATAQRLRDKGGDVTAIPADLSDPDGLAAFAAAVLEEMPSLDILVNNAGASWGAPLGEYPVDGWDKVMNVNVRSVYFLTEALIDGLRAGATAADPARVINIGSVDGLRSPTMETFAYSSSKAAVHQLTKHLANRLAREHVRVNAIAPGPFESKMMAFALKDEELRAAVANDVPVGRIGAPDDMAGAAIFLSSKAGAYLTGAVLPVGGGISSAE